MDEDRREVTGDGEIMEGATLQVGDGPVVPLDSAEARERMEGAVRRALGYERAGDAPRDHQAREWDRIIAPAQIESLAIVRKRNGSLVTIKLEVPRSSLYDLGNLDDSAGFSMRWRSAEDPQQRDRMVGESADLMSGRWTKQGDPSGPKRVSVTIQFSASEWRKLSWLGALIADDEPHNSASMGMMILEPNQQSMNLRHRAE